MLTFIIFFFLSFPCSFVSILFARFRHIIISINRVKRQNYNTIVSYANIIISYTSLLVNVILNTLILTSELRCLLFVPVEIRRKHQTVET